MATRSEWLTTVEAAAHARRHPVTIRRALEAGDLHGYQRGKFSHWLVRPACLDAWIEGNHCEHLQAVALAQKRPA